LRLEGFAIHFAIYPMVFLGNGFSSLRGAALKMYEESDGTGNGEVTMKKEEWMKMR
jgi:hypothetical protein